MKKSLIHQQQWGLNSLRHNLNYQAIKHKKQKYLRFFQWTHQQNIVFHKGPFFMHQQQIRVVSTMA